MERYRMMDTHVHTLPGTDIQDTSLSKRSCCTCPLAEADHDRKHCYSGFTLLELVMVIAIIAILTTLAITFFVATRRAAYEITVKHDLKNFVTAQELYFTDGGRFLGNPGQVIQSEGSDFSLPTLRLSPGVAITVVSGDPNNPHSQTDPFIAEAGHVNLTTVFQYNGWTNNITEKGE